MINYLSGIVSNIESQVITIKNCGFGFLVLVPNETIYAINQEVNLEIYFYWSQENGPQFFGFESKSQRDIFSLLISCSGVGPKLALLILSQMSPSDFLNAIVFADVKALSSINGIGSKKAEMLIMQLKDKVDKISYSKDKDVAITKLKEVSDVLTSLNYSKPEISIALDSIKKDPNFSNFTFDELLRKSLSTLVKKY